MHLWIEYEGRIVADQFPLVKLLQPEGRSAFFSTTSSTGTIAVIRLIEAHFDEPEILARWTAVSRIDQPTLVKLSKFGQTTLDETALLYVVMEPADATLADILQNRPLSTKEAVDVATSLVPALEALHARNLVHEHIEAANVLAIGEVVKLRSDCIREAPEGPEANESNAEAKARDVRDLALLLLQTITQQRKLPAGATLPAPFQEIVTNGISGAWGLPQISASLAIPSAPKQRIPLAPAPPAPAATQSKTYTPPVTPPAVHRVIAPTVAEDEPRRILPWTTIVAVLILALFIGWHFLHKAPAPIPTLATVPERASSSPAVAAKEVKPAAPFSENSSSAGAARAQWRVVAYTYNHENQAQEKAALIARQHSSFNPRVFAPKGHAPYLVTIGGPMTRDEALAFRKKARAAGLPRDTYAQNFPGNTR
ncbi:MAG: protein kinase [Edaphobacter sp.]